MKLVTRHVSGAKAASLKAHGLARPSKTLGFGPAGGYTPKQLAAAYGINPGGKTKQTVAIVDAFGNPSVRADLNTFDQHYGLPKETAKSFKVINQDGLASPLPTPDEGWAGEITLDVQSVRAVCHACKILLVEADSNNNSDLAAGVNQAVKKGAKIVSNSYGGPEGHGQRSAYTHKGVAILASTGDDGWYDWDNVNSGPVHRPSPDPGLLPVGRRGRRHVVLPEPQRLPRQRDRLERQRPRRSRRCQHGRGTRLRARRGGGCSTLFGAPSWQKHAKGFGTLGCGASAAGGHRGDRRRVHRLRHLRDLDWCTDPDANVCPYTSADNGWATYGGTSLASPVVAGLWGLAGGPKKGVKSPAQTLYDNFKHEKGTYDVTVGGTGGCNTQSPAPAEGCSASSSTATASRAPTPTRVRVDWWTVPGV